MSFLNAQWKNLALINYEIEASLLEKYVPKGTEIDFYNGKCYISLVGFLFQNTKLLGIKIPFHTNFEEVNLRFYVKRFENGEWKRGVVFIKEIVPKPALTWVANTVYKEHYQTLPMKHSITENKNLNTDFVYQWKTKNKWNTILMETKDNAIEIESGTTSEFITEHYFGYTKYNENKTFEYEVKHPKWQQKEIIQTVIDVDFKATYGNEFEFLNYQNPASTIFAIGSEISVENKNRIV
ncbi:YqjF family protein [Flavobacterium sp.]|uniref:YqjF family protein n=1 Tax=Flavobacterium sp. TaxID=239 RepID=UPI0035279231